MASKVSPATYFICRADKRHGKLLSQYHLLVQKITSPLAFLSS